MKKRSIIAALLFCLCYGRADAQSAPNPRVSITGSIGVTYEGYGLTTNPNTPFFYGPRRPWNQLRFNIAPQIKVGNFTLPLNFNFAAIPTNFAGPYSGLGALGHQSFGQFITNPMNNFSINPKYKWAQLLLGTQYLNYSELSTGDIGDFVRFGTVKDKPKYYLQNSYPIITNPADGSQVYLGVDKPGKVFWFGKVTMD